MDQMATLSASVAETFWPGILGFLHGIPLHHLVLAAAISGSVRIGRRRAWPLYLIFAGLYLIMIVIWWFPGMGRLIIPVWPVVVAGILEEGSHFGSLCAASIKNPRFKMIPRWALIALAIWMVIRNDDVTYRKTAEIYSTEIAQRAKDREAYRWMIDHGGPDPVVLAWKEGSSYLYTGLPSSHDLFLEKIPEADEGVGARAHPVLRPGEFKSAMLLILASDVGTSEGMDTLRRPAEALPGSHLEFTSPGALVYRLPVPAEGSRP
jgi:hypothetical protein